MFDRAAATAEVLRDDPACIEGLQAIGSPLPDKQSLVQAYRFDPSQECKLAAGDKSRVMFTHKLDAKLTLSSLDISTGTLALKIGRKGLNEKLGGAFPSRGSLLPDEYVSAKPIQDALADVASRHLSEALPAPVAALFNRLAPATQLQEDGESTALAAIRVAGSMAGGCLVIQGPPGTGKTFTASQVIVSLLGAGKKIGIASNSHKAVVNLLLARGDAVRETGRNLEGIKVGGEAEGPLFSANPGEGGGGSRRARGRSAATARSGTADWKKTLSVRYGWRLSHPTISFQSSPAEGGGGSRRARGRSAAPARSGT